MSAARSSLVVGVMTALMVASVTPARVHAAQNAEAKGSAGSATVSSADRLRSAQQLVATARQLEAQSDLEGAIARLQEAVMILPAWAPSRGLLGRLYQMQGQDEPAKEQYKSHQLLSLLGQVEGDADPFVPKLAEAEGLMTFLINQERMTRGLCVLEPSAELSKIARGHSEEMRDRGYFSHVSPVKSHATPVDRFVKVYGQKPRGLAENLARRYGTLYSFSLKGIAESHADLMKSPRHRHSILWDKVQLVGVGIAVNGHGDYWITEMFARLR